jgi:hypothetical protein
MKTLFSLCVSVILLTLSTRAQDIFVYKNGSIQTCFTIIKEFPDFFQVQAQERGGFSVPKKLLAYVQKANGQQIVYDNAKHPTLTLIDFQDPTQLRCFATAPKPQTSINAAAIDNQTPGSKATVKGAQVTLFRDQCLMLKVHAYLAVGDEVTIERLSDTDAPQGFTGSYLVSFVSNGLILKGWVRRTNFEIEPR